jgi:hypothetical protein
MRKSMFYQNFKILEGLKKSLSGLRTTGPRTTEDIREVQIQLPLPLYHYHSLTNQMRWIYPINQSEAC